MEECKKVIGKNAFKISGTTWAGELELPDGFHSVSDIRDYIGCVNKKGFS